MIKWDEKYNLYCINPIKQLVAMVYHIIYFHEIEIMSSIYWFFNVNEYNYYYRSLRSLNLFFRFLRPNLSDQLPGHHNELLLQICQPMCLFQFKHLSNKASRDYIFCTCKLFFYNTGSKCEHSIGLVVFYKFTFFELTKTYLGQKSYLTCMLITGCSISNNDTSGHELSYRSTSHRWELQYI